MCNMALRIFALSFPFYVYNKFLMSYYQTILQPGLSTVITALQGFLVIVPLTLGGIFLWGLFGVCAAAVVSEAATILLSCLYRMRGQRKGRFERGVYMLPEVEQVKNLDCSIRNDLDEVIAFREKLFSFCEENHITERDAKILGLAMEEIAANIVQYGYRDDRKNYMDISFTIQDDKYILRIRDDGIPFNPLEYRPDGEEQKEDVTVGGIALLKKIMSDFQYMRVLNMNNTVAELNIVPK